MISAGDGTVTSVSHLKQKGVYMLLASRVLWFMVVRLGLLRRKILLEYPELIR